MEDNLIVTLSEFVDIFGGIDQIHSIYVDSDDDLLRNQMQGNPRPLDILRDQKNIMVDDEYLVLCNGDYVLNKEKVFEDYGNYFVSMYFPIIPPEYSQEANVLVKTTSEKEYLGHIAQYSNGVVILIKKTLDFNIKFSKALNPDVNSSINGYMICDYYELSEDISDMYCTPEIINEFVAIVDNETEMFNVLEQRITCDSIVFEIKNGKKTNVFRLFSTDKDGKVTELTGGTENDQSGSEN